MKAIGGFLELELPKGKNYYHTNTVALTNGRSCLNLIIQEVKPKKIYLPYYSCDSLIEPMRLNGVPYEYYHLNSRLDPILPKNLNSRDYVLYINYFGIKTRQVEKLSRIFGQNLIIDNAQAFFEKNYSRLWAFNSCRKFFGVPDGAFLYSPDKLVRTLKKSTNVRHDYLLNRLLGRETIAYRQFLSHENKMKTELRHISELSRIILSNVNFSQVKKKRRSNFEFLHRYLKAYNRLKFDYSSETVPFCYPLLVPKTIDKKIFYKNKIYIPTYWKRLAKKKAFKFENNFSSNLLPLPIDQRYNHCDLQRVADFTLKLLNLNKITKIGKQ